MYTHNIGAFFQCYKQPYATYKCLESFRNVYKTEPIVLLSSNGHNYGKMANYFQCTYVHSNENLPYIQELIDDYKTNVKKLIDRIVSAFVQLDCKYVIWLEDDVFVNKRLPMEFKYDINGYAPNNFNKK